VIGFIIGDIAQHFINHLYYAIVYLQFAAGAGEYQFYDMEMQELCFGTCFYERGMPVVILEKGNTAIMFEQRGKKIIFKFEDGAFVGYVMGMCNGAFVIGFGHQHATGIGIERLPEYIEQEISFAHEADAKSRIVFRF
jgi:hypothetical protein